MIKLLPFILIPVLVIGGFLYFRFFSIKQSLEKGPTEEANVLEETELREVPATLPSTTPKVQQVSVNSSPSSSNDSSVASKINSLEEEVTNLKTRIFALEKAPQASANVATSTNVPSYIPLGAGGSNSNNNWADMPGYEISIDPADYTGYSGMQLEVNMRLNAYGGNAIVRLVSSSGSAISSEVSTSKTLYNLNTSLTFKLPTGKNTYKLQVKSSGGEMFIQDARIKVIF